MVIRRSLTTCYASAPLSFADLEIVSKRVSRLPGSAPPTLDVLDDEEIRICSCFTPCSSLPRSRQDERGSLGPRYEAPGVAMSSVDRVGFFEVKDDESETHYELVAWITLPM